MTIPAHPIATLRGSNASIGARPRVALLGVGTAAPELRWAQADSAREMAAIWNLQGEALDRWQRIIVACGIDNRHGVMPPRQVVKLTTAQRMTAYERFAPPLAESAARRALTSSGVVPEEITDVVVVSCTGFSAPGLDVALIERLGLSQRTRRTTVGFMGCFGAINGLRVAAGMCAADPRAVTLLVCAELCSLHMRLDSDPQNQIASALFADGAAAAVLATGDYAASAKRQAAAGPGVRDGGPATITIGRGASMLLPEGREWMTWRITDAGFAMTLTREVPVALRRSVAGFVRDLGAARDGMFIVHPGGPGVLDAVDSALDLNGSRGMPCSRRILRDFGNMSSATVLFVLERALREGATPPMTLLAFGPGLTLEGLILEPRDCAAPDEPPSD